jgi:hypothetical protein
VTDIKPDLAISDLPDASPSDPLEALSWLGETVEEIAEGLRARGIKGIPGNGTSCPLANYLSEWWAIGSVYDRYSVYSQNGEGPNFLGRLPDPCWEFILRFDANKLPDLIDNG